MTQQEQDIQKSTQFYYGAAPERVVEPVAILVCHGMGQQVRYETLSSVAHSILLNAEAAGGHPEPLVVHTTLVKEDFVARAEVRWIDKNGQEHSVHIYEAYWAPKTEGKVSYWDTVKFLLNAAGNGLRYSKPFVRTSFSRWMFGDRKQLPIGPLTFAGIVCILCFLLLQVGIIGYVSLKVADQLKATLAQGLPLASSSGIVRALLQWVKPLLPGVSILWNEPVGNGVWWHEVRFLVLWIFAVVEAFAARYFLIEFVGDVAAYISPYKDSKFDEIRHTIQKIGLDVGRIVYGFDPAVGVPDYGKIVVVGHSLGSVLAYDTLNALINTDNVAAQNSKRFVVDRTRSLVTFGSPLDKTAFIFRTQPKCEEDWIREQVVTSIQPLILDYGFRPSTFEWLNIWSPMDIISGELNYYDDPEPAHTQNRVQNLLDAKALIPLMAHTQYWSTGLLGEKLYKMVS